MCLIVYLFVVSVSVRHVSSADVVAKPLPTYIGQGCSLKDPKFSDCFINKGLQTTQILLAGDPEYNIPKLEPLEIEQININQGSGGLQLELSKCEIFGVRNLQIKDVDVDPEKRQGHITFFLDKMTIHSKYSVSGQVQGTPITGNGDANIELKYVTFTSIGKWKLDKKSNGLDYFVFTDVSIPFGVSDLEIKLDNLYNGDKQLGDSMNHFLNENWREVLKELVPAVGEAFGKAYRKIMRTFIETVPAQNLFPSD